MQRKSLIKSLDLWDFTDDPKFTGEYISTDIIQPDDPSKEAFNQHVFADVETGEQVYLPDNYSITKGIKMARTIYGENLKGVQLEIICKGETMLSNGRKFLRFDVNAIIEDDKSKKTTTPPKKVPQTKK